MAGPLQLSNKEFTYSGFHLTENGLTPVGSPSKDEWVECGRFLRHAEASVHFWIGDWLRYGEAHFKQDYNTAIELTGYTYHTLRRDKYLSERIPFERRRSNLDVAMHHEVAPLEEPLQELLLDKVEQEGLTVQQLRMEKHRLAHEIARPVGTPSVPGLFHGDCTEILKTLPDQSIDCIITDPPYGIDYQSEHRILMHDKLKNDTPEQAALTLDTALSIAQYKLKPTSHVYIFSDRDALPWMYPLVNRYFDIRNVLIWVKNNWTAGDLEASYAHRYEMIIYAHHKGRRHLNGKREGDVLFFDRVAENTPHRHPTEKPVKLLEYLIEKSTRPGETVLDCFMGSGSSGIAAKNTNRKFVGIELDEQWYQEACHRLSHTQSMDSINAPLPGTTPLVLNETDPR